MYKGYIATNNKKALQKFKDGDGLLTLEQAQQLDEYSGILGDNTVLIDIDNEEQSQILYEIIVGEEIPCKIYKTNRGAHFMFLNNGGIKANKTHCRLAIGLDADIKLGCRSSYQVLKQRGVQRDVIYDTENYIGVPKWLLPIETSIKVLGLGEGDGRNDALFRLILPLQSAGLSVDDVKECIGLINKYVLGKAVSADELKVILRDEAFKKEIEITKPASFEFHKFARMLMDNHKIIKINGVLHSYHNGLYVQNELEHLMVQYRPNITRSQRYEVLSYLGVLIRDNTEQAPANIIAFKNGLYDVVEGTFKDFTDDVVILNRVPWNYVEGAYSELMDKTLDEWVSGDSELRAVLEEMIGFTFYRRAQLGKAFVLLGNKSNGKSTFLGVLQTLLGEENVSSLDIRDLGDRFKTAELFGKLANIGDDISDDFISDSSVFKKLVTGNRVTAERKGQDPFQFDNYSKLIFSANTIPRIKDRTGAVLRRLVIIPFTGQFSGKNFNLKYKLEDDECMEYLVQLGLRGLWRLLENNGFSKSEKTEEQMREYELENNPLVGFVSEIEKLVNEECSEVYDKYLSYCWTNNFKPLGRNSFYREIGPIGKVRVVRRVIKGKWVRLFV